MPKNWSSLFFAIAFVALASIATSCGPDCEEACETDEALALCQACPMIESDCVSLYCD